MGYVNKTRKASPVTRGFQATRLRGETMKFRQAAIGDARHLARFSIMMDGGFSDALYDGLVPGQSIESIYEPKYSQSGTTDFFQNHWIAEQDGQVAGGIHSFPFDDFADDPPPDPRIPKERFAIFQPFSDLPADGAYFVNALSVYPELCRRGIASSPVRCATSVEPQ